MIGESEMMCKKPFLKTPYGVRPIDTILSEQARLGSTPFPCGQCLHCRINRSRMWQHRILLEDSVSDRSCFVTLTYNEENLPKDRSLNIEDYQKFLKLLRYFTKRKIRYVLVGEYGKKDERPHYHAILFGVGEDESEVIEKSWKKGFILVGDCNKYSP